LLLLVCAAPRRLRGAFPPTTTAVRPAGHPTRPLAAARVAVTEMCMNHVRPAITLAEEGVDLARQLGYENDEPGYLGLQAWFAALRGREADCRRCRRRSAAPRPRGRYRLGDERGAPRLTLLELVTRERRSSSSTSSTRARYPRPPCWATPEYIEAACGSMSRSGLRRAYGCLRRILSAGRHSFTLLARCGAILAEDDREAERLFADALEMHGQGATPYEARPHPACLWGAPASATPPARGTAAASQRAGHVRRTRARPRGRSVPARG
jgi:hypothetical protein